jgi:excisionase family DNA binding protein
MIGEKRNSKDRPDVEKQVFSGAASTAPGRHLMTSADVTAPPPIARERSSTNLLTTTIPFSQRLACTVAEACEATGLGRTKLYELIGEGQLDTTTIGRRRLVMVRSLVTLLAPEDA